MAPGHGSDTWPLAVEMKGHVGKAARICGVVPRVRGHVFPWDAVFAGFARDCQTTVLTLP